MQRVLVTGGTGYVGSVLVPALLNRGYAVRVYDKQVANPNARSLWIGDCCQVIQGDILDSAALSDAVHGCDYIVHLAAIVGHPQCDARPEEAWRTNVDGTSNLLDCSGSLPVVLMSSLSSLGRVEGVICDESTPTRPMTLYGETKAALERLGEEYGNAVILRPGTAFGLSARWRSDLLLHEFVRLALSTGKIEVFEPDAWRPLVHVRDIARAIIQMLMKADDVCGRTFHVGADFLNVRKGDVAALVARATGAKVETTDTRTDPDRRYYVSSFDRLASTGFTPKEGLDVGLAEAIAAVSNFGPAG